MTSRTAVAHLLKMELIATKTLSQPSCLSEDPDQQTKGQQAPSSMYLRPLATPLPSIHLLCQDYRREKNLEVDSRALENQQILPLDSKLLYHWTKTFGKSQIICIRTQTCKVFNKVRESGNPQSDVLAKMKEPIPNSRCVATLEGTQP